MPPYMYETPLEAAIMAAFKMIGLAAATANLPCIFKMLPMKATTQISGMYGNMMAIN